MRHPTLSVQRLTTGFQLNSVALNSTAVNILDLTTPTKVRAVENLHDTEIGPSTRSPPSYDFTKKRKAFRNITGVWGISLKFLST